MADMSEQTHIIITVITVIIGPIVHALLTRGVKNKITSTAESVQAGISDAKAAVVETRASVEAANVNIAQQSTGIRDLVNVTAAAEVARRIGSDTPSMMAVLNANVHEEITALEKRIADLRVIEAEEELKRKANAAFDKLAKEAGLEK